MEVLNQSPQPLQPSLQNNNPGIFSRNRIKFILIFILLSSLIAFLVGGYILGQKGKSSKQVVCTQEVKICPDGTSVGRTGPNCDFAPCPSSASPPQGKPTDETANPDLIGANWKTYTNQKHQISFKYPLEWNPIPNQPALILGPKEERLSFNEDGSLMNECMEDTSVSEVNIANTIFTKKTFKGIKFGAACAGDALGKKEVWIQPKSKQFGLQFEYLDSNAQEAEKIFNQILSTFKFLSNENQGIISGKISIGPLCPVEPCQNSVNPYLNKEIILTPRSGNSTTIKLNSDGSFSSQLDPGKYSLNLNECEYLGCSRTLPKTVSIESGKTTEVNIDIDTGIR